MWGWGGGTGGRKPREGFLSLQCLSSCTRRCTPRYIHAVIPVVEVRERRGPGPLHSVVLVLEDLH